MLLPVARFYLFSVLYSIPLCEYVIMYLSIPLSADIWDVARFWL